MKAAQLAAHLLAMGTLDMSLSMRTLEMKFPWLDTEVLLIYQSTLTLRAMQTREFREVPKSSKMASKGIRQNTRAFRPLTGTWTM